jgi:hypothetical protein
MDDHCSVIWSPAEGLPQFNSRAFASIATRTFSGGPIRPCEPASMVPVMRTDSVTTVTAKVLLLKTCLLDELDECSLIDLAAPPMNPDIHSRHDRQCALAGARRSLALDLRSIKKIFVRSSAISRVICTGFVGTAALMGIGRGDRHLVPAWLTSSRLMESNTASPLWR